MTTASPLPLTILGFLAGVGTAAGVVRLIRRRDRHAARGRGTELSEALAAFLAARLESEALAAIAEDADPGTFWTALESVEGGPETRRRLGTALGACAAVEAECLALRDDSPWRRELAARRVGLLDTSATREALLGALAEGPEPVTAAAALGLARLGEARALRWVLDHPAALGHRTPRARVALFRAFGPQALPVLAGALETCVDPRQTVAIVETLGLAPFADARHAIERRLADPDLEVRVAAARALGRIGRDDAGSALAAALRDEAWPVRAQAAWALGRTRAPIGILALPPRLTDSSWWVRHHAARALAALGEMGVAELRAIAGGSPDPFARDTARAALERVTRSRRQAAAGEG